ncbi:MAG TPA: carbohydrate ABC transporter permease [Phycisphaerales bacterium]|nr:carbohydrate ABC transporter permease [Phycisphaerales bacterium]
MNRPRNISRLLRLTLIAMVGTLFAVPLAWMVVVALRPASPSAPDGLWAILGNLREVWNSPSADFPTYFRNSLWVAILSSAGMTISSAICAYGFSRLRWRGRDTMFMLVLATLMIPPVVIMAPLYAVFRSLGWIGTLVPLWAPSWFGGAFSIFLLRQFFSTIPRELDEAARIDGCGPGGIFFRVVLPSSLPALAAVALMQFIASWNDFLAPLLLTNHQEHYTLSLGLHMFNEQHGQTPWPLVMTASCITVAPVLLVYILARRWFVDGVSATGLKE